MCPTKENIKYDQFNLPLYRDLSSRKNRVTYIKTGTVKDIFFQDKTSVRRYKVSSPKALVHIHQKENTPYISEFLEDALILLQEQEGTKSNCRVLQAQTAFYDYNTNTLSSPELYFSLFDSFSPNPKKVQWQGITKKATLLLKQGSSPILQTGFTTFFNSAESNKDL